LGPSAPPQAASCDRDRERERASRERKRSARRAATHAAADTLTVAVLAFWRLTPAVVEGTPRLVTEILVEDRLGGGGFLRVVDRGIQRRQQERGGGLGRERALARAQVVCVVASIEIARVRWAVSPLVQRAVRFVDPVDDGGDARAVARAVGVREAVLACPIRR
jgi:hypothetical protein